MVRTVRNIDDHLGLFEAHHGISAKVGRHGPLLAASIWALASHFDWVTTLNYRDNLPTSGAAHILEVGFLSETL